MSNGNRDDKDDDHSRPEDDDNKGDPPSKKTKPGKETAVMVEVPFAANNLSPPTDGAKDNATDDDDPSVLLFSLTNHDIWVNGIFPFVGRGHYIFVAIICRQWKEWYKEYFDTVEEKEDKNTNKATTMVRIPVHHFPGDRCRRIQLVRATFTNTYYSAAFSSLSCAKYWDDNTTTNHPQNGNNNNNNSQKHRYSSSCSSCLRLNDNYVCEMIVSSSTARGSKLLEIVKWAREEKGFPWDEMTSAYAGKNGHLDLLQYAHENGFLKWNSRTCTYAAASGNLKVLQFAHDNGCPWNEWTCAFAAKNGHLATLQYAHRNGCPWDVWTCCYAA